MRIFIVLLSMPLVAAFQLLHLPRNHQVGVGHRRARLPSTLQAKYNRKGTQSNRKQRPSTPARGSKKNSNKTTTAKKVGGPGGPTAQPQKTKKKSTGSAPPWQVLSSKDAKINIEKEKIRRQRARQGDHSVNDQDGEQLTLSTAFLSEMDQRFLNWKRFNPNSAPNGMKFVGSYLNKRLPPSMGVPEVAFLGRSNVGKSSLLNRLSASAGQRDQARVGKTPGATASVNLYALADSKGKEILGWADLPGFGYARLSKEVKESVQAAAENYLGKRKELCLGILLVDIRREPSADDRAVLAALYDLGVPLVVVATKIDKVSSNQLESCLETIRDGLGLPEGQPLAVSSTKGEGTRELWKIILEACEEGVRAKKLKYDEETRKQKELDDQEEHETEEFDSFADDDDIVYSQGYDWIHGGSDNVYEGEPGEIGDFDDEDGWEYYEDDFDDDLQSQRESFQQLRQRARDMEKRGEI